MKLRQLVRVGMYLLLFAVVSSCGEPERAEKSLYNLPDSFGDYWYQGEAELTSYELTQVRYGQEHEGHAVLIFVTEPFSRNKQVKFDNPEQVPEERKQQVMKCNFTKKFNTGIYPYSTMASIFSPTQSGSNIHAVKETYSAQEWCGQTFYQLNKKGQRYNWMGFSYFESEGDQGGSMPLNWMEDEIWNIIRLQPDKLPTGTIQMVPSLEFIRMAHKELKAYEATAGLEQLGELMRYTIEYSDLKRTLTIDFHSEFPHQIEGWTERRSSGFGEDRQMMTTTATKKERLTLDYWNHNQVRDSVWRTKLGISEQP